MAYVDSNLDKTLRDWFRNDASCATLHQIILKGGVRGLKDTDIEFTYPIAAIAGKNGSGKTTLLALAACAYHNTENGFKAKSRKRPYYTFSDFFIQTHEEKKLDGINISYKFLHNRWKNLPSGFGYQKMSKRKGGKWSRYEKRMKKNVMCLGIDRLVPQTERQVYKTYVKYFTDDVVSDWHLDVRRQVGKVLDKNYSQFKLKKAGTYNLQFVKEANNLYSGFNMGAGEKALFELFSLIYQCSNSGKSSLIIVDEIELGLHELAQRRLIDSLKEICKKNSLQIIFTTHSPTILNSLPPDARFFIEKSGADLIINKGISGEFAAGRLAEKNSGELDIYVEDTLANTLLNSFFNLEMRQRTCTIPIGSFSAVCRQLSAAYKHPKLKNRAIAILDGDQRANLVAIIDKMVKDLELSNPIEKAAFKTWVQDKLYFIPGKSNPEKWIIENAITCLDKSFATRLGINLPQLKEEMALSLNEAPHDEFYYLSTKLSMDEEMLIRDYLSNCVNFKNRSSKQELYLDPVFKNS